MPYLNINEAWARATDARRADLREAAERCGLEMDGFEKVVVRKPNNQYVTVDVSAADPAKIGEYVVREAWKLGHKEGVREAQAAMRLALGMSRHP